MQDLYVVNASRLLPDAEVQAKVAPLQKQFDRDFVPAWGEWATPVRVRFASMNAIPSLPADAWAIFLNKHSKESDALGWHDHRDGRVFARVFVGDCLLMGLDWGVTLSHEALELNLNPRIVRVYHVTTGRYVGYKTPLEACDAVEGDQFAYDVDGYRMSNFVTPYYYSTRVQGPFDHRRVLRAPFPSLSSGGYASLIDGAGNWSQIYADKANNLPARRFILTGFRRTVMRQLDSAGLLEVSP